MYQNPGVWNHGFVNHSNNIMIRGARPGRYCEHRIVGTGYGPRNYTQSNQESAWVEVVVVVVVVVVILLLFSDSSSETNITEHRAGLPWWRTRAARRLSTPRSASQELPVLYCAFEAWKQRGSNHNETHHTQVFCTVPLPKIPLVLPSIDERNHLHKTC